MTMNRKATQRGWAIAVMAWAWMTTAAHAGGVWQFTEIADTSTAIPGGTGTFTNFYSPALNNGVVAFVGYGGPNSTVPGIYTGTAGPVQLVANTATTAPGDTSAFNGFERPSIDASGNVAFVATVADGNQGAYAQIGGSLVRIADTTTATPGFNGTFSEFTTLGSASIDHGTVSFAGFSRGGGGVDQGIYTWSNGSLSLVADRSTALPFGAGTTTYTFIERSMINNGNVIFDASAGTAQGIYELKNGSLTRVIDSTMTLPGTSSTFQLEGTVDRGPILFGDRTAFFAAPSKLSDYGYYGTDPNGNLVPLVTYHTIPTGYSVPFTGLDYLSLGTKGFVFWGSSSQIPGDLFYESYDGSVFQKIIGYGDTLDGKTVNQVFASDYSYNDGELAVTVQFTDGTYGVFLGSQSVPEPSSLILLAFGGTGLAFLARRRRPGRRVGRPPADGAPVRGR
jgi:hypothetical protein